MTPGTFRESQIALSSFNSLCVKLPSSMQLSQSLSLRSLNAESNAPTATLGRIARAWILAGATLLIPTFAAAQISTDTPTQLSLSTAGGAPTGGASGSPAAGASGKTLAFASAASDLVAGDTNSETDVFYRDPTTNLIVRASVSSSGVEGNGDSVSPSISQRLPSGFFALAFQSAATNLGSITFPNARNSIFVRIPSLNVTELVSSGLGFSLPDGPSASPSIKLVQNQSGVVTALIAFSSLATNLVQGDTNNVSDIFIASFTPPASNSYNPQTLVSIRRITESAVAGQQLDADSFSPQLSDDGRYVTFASRATNLVSPPISNPNQSSNIYRFDAKTGATILVSKSKTGTTPGNGDSLSPQINFNGRYIAYQTFAFNIVGNSSGALDAPFVVRYDGANDTNELVNVSSDGQTTGSAQQSAIGLSANGRLVTFADEAVLVAGDTNARADLFVKDMNTGQLALLSRGPGNTQSNSDSIGSAIVANTLNGLSYNAVFESFASNLTQNSTASGALDLYSAAFTVAAPPLNSDSRLETPPDVELQGRKVRLTSQPFTLAPVAARDRDDTSTQLATRRAIRYEFNVVLTTTSSGRRRIQRSTIISKRNTITVSKARGRYAVKNRIRVINSRTGRVLSRTPFSPTQTLTVSR